VIGDRADNADIARTAAVLDIPREYFHRREWLNPDYSTVSGSAQGVGTRGRLTTLHSDAVSNASQVIDDPKDFGIQ
jgi:hypothetical protein